MGKKEANSITLPLWSYGDFSHSNIPALNKAVLADSGALIWNVARILSSLCPLSPAMNSFKVLHLSRDSQVKEETICVFEINAVVVARNTIRKND